MHNPAQAYGQTARVVSNPRELEASLLIKAAKQLQAAKDNWEPRSSALRDALVYNRKLWTVFAGSVTDDSNPLPREIRQNIANLSVFVLKRTLEVQARPEQRKLDALISINREIAAGLFTRPQVAEPAGA